MGAGPHRHPCPVNDGCHVMGVGPVHVEGEDGALVSGAAKDAERIDFGQALGGIVPEIGLMGGDVVEADACHVVERRAKADGLDDGRGSGLEAVRRVVVGDVVQW